MRNAGMCRSKHRSSFGFFAKYALLVGIYPTGVLGHTTYQTLHTLICSPAYPKRFSTPLRVGSFKGAYHFFTTQTHLKLVEIFISYERLYFSHQHTVLKFDDPIRCNYREINDKTLKMHYFLFTGHRN